MKKLPCPFCGLSEVAKGILNNLHFLGCKDCGFWIYRNEESLVLAAWNHRPAAPRQKGEGEALLREALEIACAHIRKHGPAIENSEDASKIYAACFPEEAALANAKPTQEGV